MNLILKKYLAKKIIYDLVDSKDHIVSQGTKQQAKKLRLFTRSVHILLFNERKEILICKRSSTKRSYPNQITSSAGGHVEIGENYETAAKRELKEELGIEISLRDTGRFNVVTKKERAIHHLYVGEIKTNVHPDPAEISQYYFSFPKIIKKDLISHPRKYCKPFHLALDLYLQQIKK